MSTNDSVTSELLGGVAAGAFDFLDFGCGTGGSIRHVQKMFRCGQGLGIETDTRKVRTGREQGYKIACADVGDLTLPSRSVAFVSMMDFLEHLSDMSAARKALGIAADVARDFLYIRHPSFEDIDYLAGFGLKLCWTDWHGHPNMMRLSDFREIFEAAGLGVFAVIPQSQIIDSEHAAIVPVDAPTDTTSYDPDAHGARPLVSFERPVFSQFDIYVSLRGSDIAARRRLARQIPQAVRMMPWGRNRVG